MDSAVLEVAHVASGQNCIMGSSDGCDLRVEWLNRFSLKFTRSEDLRE